MTQRTAELFDAETQMTARQLYGHIVGHVERLSVLLDTPSPSYRRQLTATAGEAAALAGWVAYDQGNMGAADAYYTVAQDAATEADASPVRALVMAYQSYAMPDRPEAAAQLLAGAQHHVRGHGCATARSWLTAREAEERASCGDREGALRALDRAYTIFDYAKPDSEQPWVNFFSQARLDSMAVSTYGRLHHPDLDRVSHSALSSLTPEDAKVRAVILGDVATAYVQQGNLDAGVEVARDALTVTQRAEATLGRQRLSALAAQLPTTHPSARQLRDALCAL